MNLKQMYIMADIERLNKQKVNLQKTIYRSQKKITRLDTRINNLKTLLK